MRQVIKKMFKGITKEEIIASEVFSWSIVIGLFLQNNISLNIINCSYSILISIILSPIIIIVIQYVFRCFAWLNSNKDEIVLLTRKRRFLIVGFGLILCWLPYFMAYYPGIFAYDVGNQMTQIISGNYHTKHPLLHTLLIQFFYSIGGALHSNTLGIAFYCLFQMIVLAYIISYVYLTLCDIKVGKYFRILFLCYFCFFPVHSMLAISVTKDVIFSGLVLLFVVLFYKNTIRIEKGDKKNYTILVIVAVIMCLFRNNAIYAVALLGLFKGLKYIRKKSKKRVMLLFFGIVFVGYLVLNHFLIYITHANQGSNREALSVPLQQISRTYNYHLTQLSEDEKKEIEKLIPDVLSYNSILADPVKASAEVRQNESEILKLWLKFLLKYPETYVEAFLYNSFGNWYIDDTSNAFVYDNPGETRRGYLISYCDDQFGVVHYSYFGWLEQICEQLFSYNMYQKIPIIRIIFAPALYFWLIFFVGIKSMSEKQENVLTIVCFLLLYHFTIMCGPCCLVRYMYPFMITMPFVIGVYLCERENRKN